MPACTVDIKGFCLSLSGAAERADESDEHAPTRLSLSNVQISMHVTLSSQLSFPKEDRGADSVSISQVHSQLACGSTTMQTALA